jgi:2-polyprenyl-6-methoxyphenol hydroxylase-like FAD-dependent oxidoreductase
MSHLPAPNCPGDVVIAGGGPAGMFAGLLFARAGLRTVVLEKHGDFLRDFRGDTVHPSTLTLFHELGLLDAFLTRPHQKVSRLSARIAGERLDLIDFSRLPVPAPYIALMPQWDFLDFLNDAASAYPGFELVRRAEVVAPVERGGRVTGVRTADGRTFDARLVIAADGRNSVLRGGLPSQKIGAPMDVFWFALPKRTTADNASMGVFDAGRIVILIDRGDYWQCALVVPKGGADRLKNEGLAAFRDMIRSVGPETVGVQDTIGDWSDISPLRVAVDHLTRWHRPGLLVIGDAAHAMSPIAGVGINLAIQDAVAAANILAAPMHDGKDPDPLLADVQARRLPPTRMTQALQRAIQNRVIAPLIGERPTLSQPPLAARLLGRFPPLRTLPGRLIGLGFRPEHIRSPDR